MGAGDMEHHGHGAGGTAVPSVTPRWAGPGLSQDSGTSFRMEKDVCSHFMWDGGEDAQNLPIDGAGFLLCPSWRGHT